MLHNPYKVVQMFEEEVAHYTGSPHAVSVNSCTNALFLACKWAGVEGKEVILPKRTYLSPPQSVMQAKRLTSGMYIPGTLMCLSFHIKKHLKIGKGGMILCDDAAAAKWLKARRYEGRTDGMEYHEDMIDEEGWNMYMTPEQAARGLTLMQSYPENMPDIPEDPPYRDLTEFELFKNIEVR